MAGKAILLKPLKERSRGLRAMPPAVRDMPVAALYASWVLGVLD